MALNVDQIRVAYEEEAAMWKRVKQSSGMIDVHRNGYPDWHRRGAGIQMSITGPSFVLTTQEADKRVAEWCWDAVKAAMETEHERSTKKQASDGGEAKPGDGKATKAVRHPSGDGA